MINMIKTDLQKVFTLSGFYIAIMGICLLNLVNLLDEIRIYTVLDDCSVLYLYIMRHDLGAFSVLNLFLCALPFVITFCTEWKCNNAKYNIIRSSKNKYSWSKVIVTAIAGFLVCQIGYMILILVLDLYLPLYPKDITLMENYLINAPFAEVARNQQSYSYFFVTTLSESFAFSFLSVAALFVSSKVTNIFIVLSSPILFYYGWNFLSGTLNFPYILCWPLFMNEGISAGFGATLNLFCTMLYFMAGIILLGLLSVKNIKGRMEYV